MVTNPPFSLFREYVAQLMEYDKKFLIIGNMNATTYKEIFSLIKDNKLWYGASIKSGDREFGVPPHYPLTAASTRVDDSGNKFVRVKGVRWFTNLDITKRHEDLILYKTYSPEEYPTMPTMMQSKSVRQRIFRWITTGKWGFRLAFWTNTTQINSILSVQAARSPNRCRKSQKRERTRHRERDVFTLTTATVHTAVCMTESSSGNVKHEDRSQGTRCPRTD